MIDDDNMLVGIDNGGANPGGGPRYSVAVRCKFPTTGLTDGRTDYLENLLGTKSVTAGCCHTRVGLAGGFPVRFRPRVA